MTDEAAPPPKVHSVRDLGSVPVYNCHVYLAPPDAAGLVVARGATLPEVRASGYSDREALQNVVREFKSAITRYTAARTPIPWIEPPEPPAPGEKPRWVPVHF